MVRIISNCFQGRTNFPQGEQCLLTIQVFKQMLEIVMYENLAKNLRENNQFMDYNTLHELV